MQLKNIETVEELERAILDSSKTVEFVPRLLLIELLNEKAQELLPTLPDLVAINIPKAKRLLEK